MAGNVNTLSDFEICYYEMREKKRMENARSNKDFWYNKIISLIADMFARLSLNDEMDVAEGEIVERKILKGKRGRHLN